MTIYLDTSVVVAACANEPASAAVFAWLERHKDQALAISDWTRAEFAAAIAMKARTRALSEQGRATANRSFAVLSGENFTVVPVSTADFMTTVGFCDRHDLGLRAGDALHLAICANRGFSLCTFDKMQRAACETLGIAAVFV